MERDIDKVIKKREERKMGFPKMGTKQSKLTIVIGDTNRSSSKTCRVVCSSKKLTLSDIEVSKLEFWLN